MSTQVCAVIESNSTTTQKDSSNTDSVVQLFTIKNVICAILETKPKITQVEFVIPEEVFPSVQRWNIQFMLLMSKIQQQHKGNIPLQMTYYQVLCNEKSELCCC